jgi:hypothetical protein
LAPIALLQELREKSDRASHGNASKLRHSYTYLS